MIAFEPPQPLRHEGQAPALRRQHRTFDRGKQRRGETLGRVAANARECDQLPLARRQ